jgi:hypothetical protein
MAITQGSPLPDITTTATRTDTAPDYYTNYLTGLPHAGAIGCRLGSAADARVWCPAYCCGVIQAAIERCGEYRRRIRRRNHAGAYQ